jgi:hypothetical protein
MSVYGAVDGCAFLYAVITPRREVVLTIRRFLLSFMSPKYQEPQIDEALKLLTNHSDKIDNVKVDFFLWRFCGRLRT